ncbi:hypothetical protein HMPREF1146_1702 [Prevotella sp. MSX73]|nr:hypothetical protein HMPREF1146_1702 [Prevotella sp. MSX73]
MAERIHQRGGLRKHSFFVCPSPPNNASGLHTHVDLCIKIRPRS